MSTQDKQHKEQLSKLVSKFGTSIILDWLEEMVSDEAEQYKHSIRGTQLDRCGYFIEAASREYPYDNTKI